MPAARHNDITTPGLNGVILQGLGFTVYWGCIGIMEKRETTIMG